MFSENREAKIERTRCERSIFDLRFTIILRPKEKDFIANPLTKSCISGNIVL
jgi:hypothetical protein